VEELEQVMTDTVEGIPRSPIFGYKEEDLSNAVILIDLRRVIPFI
jgi:hypothetical protein